MIAAIALGAIFLLGSLVSGWLNREHDKRVAARWEKLRGRK